MPKELRDCPFRNFVNMAQADSVSIWNRGKGTLRFRSFFPVIGLGNVLRGSLVTSSEIDSEIDKILGD